MKRDFRDIKGFEDLFRIDINGKVIDAFTGKEVEPKINKKGYKYVKLTYWDGTKKDKLVHRLVAENFPEICGKYVKWCQVHHKDGDKLNNNANNLEILTREAHFFKHQPGLKRSFDLGEVSFESMRPVLQFVGNELIAEYRSSSIASTINCCSNADIVKCCNGEINDVNGFVYKYKFY